MQNLSLEFPGVSLVLIRFISKDSLRAIVPKHQDGLLQSAA